MTNVFKPVEPVKLADIARAAGGTVAQRAIAMLISDGTASNSEIASALGVTIRAVQKARKTARGRTTVREPQFAQANHSSQNEPQFANHSSPSEPQFASTAPALARASITTRGNIESLRDKSFCEETSSTLSVENLSDVGVDARKCARADGGGDVLASMVVPSPAAPPAKVYAFEGDTIRLTEADLVKWRKAYPAIRDLEAELLLADAYYTERPEKLHDGKWYFAVSRWLSKANATAKADDVNEVRVTKWGAKIPRGMTRKEFDEMCPPEFYAGAI